MKIKAKNPSAVAGIKLIVPVDGLIIIDNDGCVEVSPECAKNLVNGTSDWEYAEKAPEEKTETSASVTETPEPEVEDDEREKFAQELKGMTVEEMKNLCREGGLPEKEWKNLKKSLLTAYLMSKFDDLNNQEEEEEEEE